MAKLQTETIVIQVSKLRRDNEAPTDIISDEVVASLEAVVQELAGAGALVEITVE
jgi:hypothetical protein